MAVSEAGCGCGFDAGCVFVDTSYGTGAFKPSPAPNPSRVSGVLERLTKAPFSQAATQPRSHRFSVISDRLQLSCFQLGVRGPRCLALLAGGLGISTEAQQPLELKRNARDRIII
jgi:hypothetical protein